MSSNDAIKKSELEIKNILTVYVLADLFKLQNYIRKSSASLRAGRSKQTSVDLLHYYNRHMNVHLLVLMIHSISLSCLCGAIYQSPQEASSPEKTGSQCEGQSIILLLFASVM